jgi:mannose-6-phosphate isomerase-like protein (cupin superfamily)
VSGPKVTLIPADGGDEIDFRGAIIRRKAARTDTDGAWAIGTGRQNAGFDNPRHTHDETEAFYVVRGKYSFYTEEGEVEAGPGAFVLIPPGAIHGFRTEEDGSELICVWPTDVERNFFGES